MFRPAPVCRLGLNRRSSSAVRFVICPTRFCHAGGTFAAAYLRYCRYIDPQTGEVSDLFTVLQWLQLQRRHLQQRNGYLWAPGLTLWKSAILKPFLQTATNRLSFHVVVLRRAPAWYGV